MLRPASLALGVILFSPASGPTGSATGAEVGPSIALDVVVRDEQGGLVLDLGQPETEIYQDGVRQELADWRLVTREGGAGAAPVALVFDRLAREPRRAAHAGAGEWLEGPALAGRQVAVFRLGAGLEMVQAFTGDGAALANALEEARAADASPEGSRQDRERLRVLRSQGGKTTAALEGARSMERAILQAEVTLERDHPGFHQVNGLLALVNGLGTMPGRKALVLFSEGIAFPNPDLDGLPALISAANRAHVAVYAVEPTEARGDTRPLAEAPVPSLAHLALETGGAVITGSRAIVAGLRQAEEDLGAHYLVSYVPAEESWDGGFRRVEVRVSRDGVRVQQRGGFLAVRTPMPTPILEHEAAALAALEGGTLEQRMPLRVEPLQFPDEGGWGVVAVVADLPGDSAVLQRAEGDERVFTQDFTLLTVVRDDSAGPVHKSSRRYVLSWGEESLPRVAEGRVLFARETALPPGQYTVHVVARDARGGATGLETVSLQVPAGSDEDLRVSSLVVVGHAEPNATDNPSPLLYDGYQLFPNLGDPLSRSAAPQLTFLFTLRPGERPLATATVELMRDGSSVVQSSVALPSPDSTGQMQVVKGLEIGSFEPGPYVLRLRVNNARGFQTRSASFTLGP